MPVFENKNEEPPTLKKQSIRPPYVPQTNKKLPVLKNSTQQKYYTPKPMKAYQTIKTQPPLDKSLNMENRRIPLIRKDSLDQRKKVNFIIKQRERNNQKVSRRYSEKLYPTDRNEDLFGDEYLMLFG